MCIRDRSETSSVNPLQTAASRIRYRTGIRLLSFPLSVSVDPIYSWPTKRRNRTPSVALELRTIAYRRSDGVYADSLTRQSVFDSFISSQRCCIEKAIKLANSLTYLFTGHVLLCHFDDRYTIRSLFPQMFIIAQCRSTPCTNWSDAR